MTTTVSTIVRAGSGCDGECEDVQWRDGAFWARTRRFFTHGPAQASPWEQISIAEAQWILRRADGPVPRTWRAAS
jgi:hypothetical protein